MLTNGSRADLLRDKSNDIGDWLRSLIFGFRQRCTVTRDSKNVEIRNMQNQIRYIRLALIVLGLWTVTLSFMIIFGAIAQLRAWQGDALSDASIVALLLGVLLTLGGGCLALRGIKFGSRDA